MHFGEHKVQLFDAIFVDDRDVEMIEKINSMKVVLEVRMVPTEAKKDVMKAIEEKFYKKKQKDHEKGGLF